MLRTIRLKNFKLHEDTKIEAAPITVFIGPNNSGKSSIFQILQCLREAASSGQTILMSPTGTPGTIDIGNFVNVLRSGETEIDISLSGIIDPGSYPKFKPRSEVNYELRVRDNFLVYSNGHLVNEYGEMEWQWIAGVQNQAQYPKLTVKGIELDFAAGPSFRLLDVSGYQQQQASQGSISPQTLFEIKELQTYIAGTPSFLMRSLHPIFPLRGFEGRGYALPDKKAETLDFINLNERAVALAGLLAYDRDLEERLSQRLTELMRIRVKVRLLEGKRVTIWAEPSDTARTDTLFVNEGTGANQLPFILVPIALTPKNETILLSEPEAHLHPKGQCELMRMLLTVAKKENIQFFIETHSEHILHVILNAVAKGEWTRDQVALLYFQNKNGVADVSRRDINQFGQVDGGLPDFFEQSLAELTEYLKALSKP